jgi:hypothetical protein
MLPGVYPFDGEAYHADPCPEPSLSSSLAKLIIGQSPLHAWTECRRLNPAWQPTERKTFDIGRAAHRAILGAGAEYVTIPDGLLSSDGGIRTAEAKAFVADARSHGVTPLKADEVANIEIMRTVAARRLADMGITFDRARSEMAAFAVIDGVWCRAMLDNAPLDPRQPIYDLKTCESAAPEACERAVLNYGYDVQAQHYREVWRAATGESRPFRFVFQEKSAPHELCVIELGDDTLTIAAKKIARARAMWRLCLDRGVWPGYPPGVHRIELPEWHAARWLERESVDADYRRQHGQDILTAAMRWQAPEPFQGAAE